MKNKQSGGNRVIPKYDDKINSNFFSKDIDKKVNKKNFNNPKTQTNRPIVENNVEQNNDLVSVKISKDLINNELNKVPAYRQIYPAPYIPVQYPAPNNQDTSGPFYPQSIGNTPYFFTANNVPVINNYRINTGGLDTNHVNLNKIYEDIMPVELRNSNYYSLRDRMLLYNFLRSSFITITDGEHLNIDHNTSKANEAFNLLDKLKLMEFNPFNFNKFSSNPYRDLSDRMILYRSCYPLSFNKDTNTVKCNKNNVFLNVRIYDMNIAEVSAKRISDKYDWNKFDLWREIGFYEYLREKIISKNICSHFPIMFAYYTCTNKKINFSKFRELQANYSSPGVIQRNLSREQEQNREILKQVYDQLRKINGGRNTEIIYFNDRYGKSVSIGTYVICIKIDNEHHSKIGYVSDIRKSDTDLSKNIIDVKLIATPIDRELNIEKEEFIENWIGINEMDVYYKLLPEQRSQLMKPRNTNMAKLNDIEIVRMLRNIKPSFTSNNCLISLTESYNYPLRMWSSKLYEKAMNTSNQMIHSGFHTEKTWMGILFQLLYTFAVMYKHKITIYNMDLDNNVFIKYINHNDNTSGYWIYIFEDIEFFIPNYGYIVMVDSNYKNLENAPGFSVRIPNYTSTIYNKTKHSKLGSDKIFKNFDDEPMLASDDIDEADDLDKINESILDNLKRIFNINNFNSMEFKQVGGITPTEKIMYVINGINNELLGSTPDYIPFNKIFTKYFSNYLHNKIGKELNKTEMEMIDDSYIVTKLKNGRIYVNNENKFVLYLENINGLNKYLDKLETIGNHTNFKDVSLTSFKKINNNNKFEQDYKLVDGKFTSNNLLDTYILN